MISRHINPAPCCGHKDCFSEFRGYEQQTNRKGEAVGHCFSCLKRVLPDQNYSGFEIKKRNNFSKFVPNSIDSFKSMDISIYYKNIYANNLEVGLRRYLPEFACDVLFDKFECFGSEKNDCSTMFFYRNVNKDVVYYKNVMYDTETCRRTGRVVSSHGFQKCIYLEWLLTEEFSKNFEVWLVESEKTALFCNILAEIDSHKKIYLAVGGDCLGRNQLTDECIDLLKKRSVKIAFDNDKAGINGAIKTRAILFELGISNYIMAPISRIENDKSDLFDIYLKEIIDRNERK